MRQPTIRLHPRASTRTLYPFLVVVLALAASGVNCAWPWDTTTGNKPRVAALRAFSSAEELRQYLVDQANTSFSSVQTGGFWSLLAPTASAENAIDTNGSGSKADSASAPFSTTTVQESGVDESDVIKNDGEYIYWLQGKNIHIVKATPPNELSEVATITLDNPASSLYLRGRQLVAVSSVGAYYLYANWSLGGNASSGNATAEQSAPDATSTSSAVASDVSSIAPTPADPSTASTTTDIAPLTNTSHTTVTLFDVSTPASPTKQATLTLEGSLAESRVIANRLYLVTTAWPVLPVQPTPATLDAIPLESWLPKYQLVGADGETRTGTTTPWEGFYRPEDAEGYEITTVVTVDLDNPTAEFKSTAITANAGLIYASPSALYITDTTSDWTTNSSREDTMIHKLAFTEAGTDYVASGLVPGRPLNQYSLGEYNDYLRIATTLETWSNTGSASASGVYVLGVSGTDLNVVGKVEDLGINEQIYSVRFIGTRGFVVTFKRIDPLYAMDLSDPTNPKVVGELKVSGYSDFMLPIDEHHLLAIGKDAQEAETWGAWVQGVQLSIFDISDLANPQRVQNTVIGGRGTNSEANYNPKAFNYFAARGAVAFPIELYSAGTVGPEWGNLEFTGVMVFSVSVTDGFRELGRISTVPETQLTNGCWWMYNGSGRGVFIGDYVYAVSDMGVKAAALADISAILGSVDFAGDAAKESCYWTEPMILPDGGSGLE